MQATSSAPRSQVGTVLRVTSGNFMEMFDFFLFGFYAIAIAKAFFPSGDEVASLMMTFMTFGAGFLMRPLGAIVLGAYVDRVGRRKGLIVTLGADGAGHPADRLRARLRHHRLRWRRCWCWSAACCRDFRPARNSAACRSTCRRWRRPGARAFM